MSHVDSHKTRLDPGEIAPSNRDKYRDIPVNASAADFAPACPAGTALDLVSDFYQIHRRKFDARPKGQSEIGRARQVAVALGVGGGLTPWQASKAFGVDLSTVKAALGRVEIRKQAEPGFAARFDALAHAYQLRLSA